MLGLFNKIKRKNQKGMTILEALVSTVIVGIGFIAIFQMVNYSVNSIHVSGESTKGNYLVTMIAEGMIGYIDTVGGINKFEEEDLIYEDGKAYLPQFGGGKKECKRFAEYYMDLDKGDLGCAEVADNIKKINTDVCADKNALATGGNFTEHYNEDDPYTAAYEHAAGNKLSKWNDIISQDQVLRCKSEKDVKTVKIFEMCAWAGDKACEYKNDNVFDEAMYLGRIQINMNNGKKRKFLYFQADYKSKQDVGG